MQRGSKHLYLKQNSTTALDNLKKKFESPKYTERSSGSLKSEEEAAITIQTMYRRYKTRRNFKQVSS